jgi:hypothetical protein
MKFKIGQAVLYRPLNHRTGGPHGAYEVIRVLPRPENTEPGDRIRNLNAGEERDVKESQLKAGGRNKR